MRNTLFILLALLGVASCSDESEATLSFALDSSDVVMGADGGTESVSVTSPEMWYASCEATWVSVSPASGRGEQVCTIAVDSTIISGARTAEVRFVSVSGSSHTLTVTQTGYGNVITADSLTVHIAASQRERASRYMMLGVTTNIAFDVSVEYEGDKQWLMPTMAQVTLDRGARPRKTMLRFDWAINTQPDPRTAYIVFTPSDPTVELSEPVRVEVTQAAAPRIDDNRAGDSLAVIAIAEALNLYNMWDFNEPLHHWSGITVWEKNDKGLPSNDAIGRLRSAQFMLMDTNEGLPHEVSYLRYAESLSFFSNVNEFLKTIDLGTAVCGLKHLRSLEIFAYGITDLPAEFAQLGGTLEVLRIGGNNLDGIPAVLTPDNFPHLRVLEMQACRRWTVSDLRNARDQEFDGGIGLHFNTAHTDDLRRLLLWSNLRELVLSYNYIEGSLPDFEVGRDGVEAWTQSDVDAWGGDTIQYLVGKPKILPHTTRLALNLNYFTGSMPDWLLYHPHLLDWAPEQLIFNQMEYGIDSEGRVVRFDNEPSNFDYYYQAFPLYRNKYEINEEAF